MKPERETTNAGRPGTLNSVFWALLIITTLLRLAYALGMPLTGDEAYFWEWARHPALSYYDHPPLAGWILILTTSILGSTVAGIRITAVLAMTGIVVIVRQTALEISGSTRQANLTGLLSMGIPFLAVTGILYSTDTPLVFAGALGGYLFYRAVEKGSDRAWLGLGLCMGAAIMSKFLGAALLAACFGYLILSSPHRHHLRTFGPYKAAIVALISFLPALYWNASHGWATFIFNFSSRHKAPIFTLKHTADYLAGQAIAMSPLVLVFAIASMFVYFPSRSRKGDALDIPAFFALVPLAGFLLISFTTKVGAHWPGVGYPMLAVAVSGYLLSDGRAGLRFVLTSAAAWITVLALLAIPLAVRYLPQEWKYPLRPERFNSAQLKKMTVSTDVIGRKIGLELGKMKADGPVFLFTKSYALSSLIAFYTPGQPEVTVLGTGSVHGRNHLLWFDPADHIGENALFASYRSFEEERAFLKERFGSVEVVSDSGSDPEQSLTIVKSYGYNGIR